MAPTKPRKKREHSTAVAQVDDAARTRSSIDDAPTLTAAQEIDEMTGDPNFMTSLARGLAVIRGFTQQKRTLTISQLSHRTGIPRAAVRRCLYTLQRLGYVGASDARNFSLRPNILGLGHAYLSSTTLATSAQPVLDHISDELHESSSIAQLEGDEILYIARSSTTRRIMSVDLGIGTRLPAYCTSMGRVLLAHLPPAELDRYFERVKLVAYTSRTVIAQDRLRKLLDAIVRTGYAIVDQELELGLRSVAVPVRDLAGKVVAAMNIGTQASRITLVDLERRLLPELQRAARDLGASLLA